MKFKDQQLLINSAEICTKVSKRDIRLWTTRERVEHITSHFENVRYG